MPVIDAHTHIFPPEIIRNRRNIARNETEFGIIYEDERTRMADRDSLLAYMREEGVDRSVVCGFPFSDSGLLQLGNDYIAESAQIHDCLIPLAAVSAAGGDGAAKEAERCFAEGARGVGEVAFYGAGLSTKSLAGLESLARLMEETGKVLLLHVNEQVGHHYPGKSSADFTALLAFIESHPELTIILAHIGGGVCFFELMPEIRKACRRVYYDTAATPFLYSSDLYKYIEACLPEKVLFGSDYPLLRLSRYKGAMGVMTQGARELVLGRNAENLFGTSLMGNSFMARPSP